MAAALCLSIAAFNADAEVAINETYNYYTVQGNSTTELRKSINKKRDKNTNMKGFDASTRWTITWTFKYLPTQTDCHITEATVTVAIEYHLPQWKGRDDSKKPAIKKAWDTYSDNLHDHELQHGNIAKTTAKQIERGLLNIAPTHGDCQHLQAKGNALASQLLKKSRQQHSDFDIATNHGSDTGAIFP